MTINVKADFVFELLQITAKHDAHSEVFWTEDLKFSIICNDFFWWGCSDAEEITYEDLALLDECLGKDFVWGPLLYCAKRRGMRPQGAFYGDIPDKLKPEFDACGPEREVGTGNPKDRNDF